MRASLAGLMLLGLMACEPIPNSAGNFPAGTSPQERAARDQALQGADAGAPMSAMRTDTTPPPAGGIEAPVQTGPLDDQFEIPENTPVTGAPAESPVTSEPLGAAVEQVITPAPGAPAPAATGATLSEFAAGASNEVGAAQYDRSFASETRSQMACGRYASADQAQEAFLNSGGPEQDGQGLDPDGDGFACGWTPGAYQSAN